MNHVYGVAPSAGAWIETRVCRTTPAETIKVRPKRRRMRRMPQDACRYRQERHARRSRIAAIALLDRAYGKPPQFNTGDTGNFRKAIDMTDDELAAIVGRAKLTVV